MFLNVIIIIIIIIKVKLSLTGHAGPEGSRMLRLPDF